MKLKTLTSATAAGAVAASLLLAPAAPAHSPTKSCRDVAFEPNSGSMAAEIRARGVSCRYARDFIGDSNGHPGGSPWTRPEQSITTSFRGFRCRGRVVEPIDDLPYARWRCTRGEGKSISWKRY